MPVTLPQAGFHRFPSDYPCQSLGRMELHIQYREYPSLFRSCDAASLGVTSHALRFDRNYRFLFRGVRANFHAMVQHPTPSWADQSWMRESLRLRALSLLNPAVVGNNVTAARLYGLPLPRRLMTNQLHLASTHPTRKMSHSRVTLHRLRALRERSWLQLRLQAPDELFMELAPVLSLDELVILGDAIVGGWHGPPLCSLEDLRSSVADSRYLRARSKTREACDLIRETVDSSPESRLRLWMIARGLPEPVVHPQVICRRLRRIAEPDLGYPNEKLALEYEGDHHRESKAQWTRDIERDEALQAEGWVVLKVTSGTNWHELELKIRSHLGLR